MEDFLEIGALSKGDLDGLISLALDLHQDRDLYRMAFGGASIASIFEKPSTRTRVSVAVAASALGARVVDVSRSGSEPLRSLKDVVHSVAVYVDAFFIRTFRHETLVSLAEELSIPVVNGLSNTHHPCQALADLVTIKEHLGALEGVRVAFVGDATSNTWRSLVEASALTGISVTAAAPERYWPDLEVLRRIQKTGSPHGSRIELVVDPEEAVRGADVVYPEVWVPMDRLHESEQRLRDLAGYRVDLPLMRMASKDAVLLHCLPANRNQEVSAEVLEGRHSLVWRQAENRMVTTQAVLINVLPGNHPL